MSKYVQRGPNLATVTYHRQPVYITLIAPTVSVMFLSCFCISVFHSSLFFASIYFFT